MDARGHHERAMTTARAAVAVGAGASATGTAHREDCLVAPGADGPRGWAELVPQSVGMGFYLDWTVCFPHARAQLLGQPPHAISLASLALGAALMAASAPACARVGAAVSGTRPSGAGGPASPCGGHGGVAGAVALAVTLLAVALPLAASVLGIGWSGASAWVLWIATLCEAVAVLWLYLAWNVRLASFRPQLAWSGYALAFGVSSVGYFASRLASGVAAGAGEFALACAFALASWVILVAVRGVPGAQGSDGPGAGSGNAEFRDVDPRAVPSARSAAAKAAAAQEGGCLGRRGVGWRVPWRPAVLMVAMTFAYYLFLHLSGGASDAGQAGRLVASLALLVVCARAFDRFDAGVLYRLCLPLMAAGLLVYIHGFALSAGAGGLLSDLAYTGFTLFMLFVMSSTSYRYEVPAEWVFGIVGACCAVAHAAGSEAGSWLATLLPQSPQTVATVVDGLIVALTFLTMMSIDGRDFDTVWGTRPDPAGGHRARGTRDADGRSPADFPATSVSDQLGSGSVGELQDFAWRVMSVARHYGLTHREEEVLSLVAQGRTTVQMEEALSIAHGTAKEHLRHVYAKLGVHSRAQAAQVVSDWGRG
ncbi:MAG: helix-turn-helix transcriptional regulator [Coriobacteriales bacterium]|jgi:DNA-binding CsgD family transcriptional regulator